MGSKRIDEYQNVGPNYMPTNPDNDVFLIETEMNGTRTISAGRVVNPYPKAELDENFKNPYSKTDLDTFFAAKQDSNGAFKYIVDDNNHTGIDNPEPDTMYSSKLSYYGIPTIYKGFSVHDANGNVSCEYVFDTTGGIRFRRYVNGQWQSLTPIATYDNINQNAVTSYAINNRSVTLPKLGSDVFASIDINTIVDDGAEADTVTGIAQCFGSFCMMEVTIHLKRSVPYNSFTLPFAPSHNVCKDFTWWTSLSSSSPVSYNVWVSASDNKCYIRRKDNGNLSGIITFSILYRRSE